jgi:hypothetical protein
MNRVTVPARQATLAGGIRSLESIPGLHERLKIRPQATESRLGTNLKPTPLKFKK